MCELSCSEEYYACMCGVLSLDFAGVLSTDEVTRLPCKMREASTRIKHKTHFTRPRSLRPRFMDHALVKPRPLELAYRSMKRMNLSHSSCAKVGGRACEVGP